MSDYWLARLQPLPPNPFDATTVDCPVCHAPKDVRCASMPRDFGAPFASSGPNHVERARNARWLKMGIIAEVAVQ